MNMLGTAVIRCQCDNDAMILQRSLEAPFTPDTRLRWSWKVESLPSARAEDSLATHDYLSLAVEFDNGQDLSYLWSAALEPERVLMPRRFVAPARDPYRDPRDTRASADGLTKSATSGAIIKMRSVLSRANSRRLADCRQYFSARPRALRVSRYRIGRSVWG